jgi:hypothetical protein
MTADRPPRPLIAFVLVCVRARVVLKPATIEPPMRAGRRSSR